MVAPEADYSILGQTGVFEFFQGRADLFVHEGNDIVVLGPVLADDWGIGIVRRECGLGGVVLFFRR